MTRNDVAYFDAEVRGRGGGFRRSDIQGLRAIAVLMVMAYHAHLPVPGGFVGVDVFFVISGFVITSMLWRECAAKGRIGLKAFYLRRFKRLTPALAVLITVTMVASMVILSPAGPQQTAAKTATGAMLLVANLVILRTVGGYFDAPGGVNPLLNTWSLSVEEQFYLAFPAVLAAGWYLMRRYQATWAPHLIVAMVAMGSFWLAVMSPHGFFSPFTRAWEFAIGSLLALVAAKVQPPDRRLAVVLGLLGAGLLGASLWLIHEGLAYPGFLTLLPVLGTLLMIAAGGNTGNPVTRMLSARPLAGLGDWSYSLYLWHWPLVVFAALLWPGNPAAPLLAVLVAFAPAVASFILIEQPIRNLRVDSRRQVAALLVITVMPPLIAAGLLLGAAEQAFWSPTVAKLQAATMLRHAGLKAGCDTMRSQSTRAEGECTWNGSVSGAPIFLVGDSNADHFSEGIIAAGTKAARPVVISTTNACPFLGSALQNLQQSPEWNEQCRTYVEGTRRDLQSSRAGTVIIANADQYWNSPLYSLSALDSRRDVADPGSRQAAISAGLLSTVRALQGAGHEVMLVQTVPTWIDRYEWSPRDCMNVAVISHQCKKAMPLHSAESSQGPDRRILRDVARLTEATEVDWWPHLCPDGLCSTESDYYVRYRDSGHISVVQSQRLADDWQAILETGRWATPGALQP